MIVESFILSIAVGFIRGGRLRNLGRTPLRHFYLFVLPFVLFAGAYLLLRSASDQPLVAYISVVNVAQYALLVIAIGLNLRVYGMPVIGVGTFFNFAAVAANGGMMPVSESAVRIAGLSQLLNSTGTAQFVRHAIMGPETRLKLLGDIVPIPGFACFLPEVASIGDVLVAVGVFILVQRYMCRPESDAKECPPGG